MKELVLGTVQLGLDYGINNKYGKPNKEEAFEILDYALENGVTILDTASAYGDSEKLIGEFIKNKGRTFKIATKLPQINISDNIKFFIKEKIEESLENLYVDKIEYYFVHSFDDIILNEGILEMLGEFRKGNKIENIGISIYEPYELEYIINNLLEYVNVVQIPFNVLDNRLLEKDLLKKAKDGGLKIFSRSTYLQGLFFADKNDIDCIDVNTYNYLELIKSIAYEKSVEVQRVLMDYVKKQENIDFILVGCEKIQQLENNIKLFNEKIILSDKDSLNIFNNSKYVPVKIIDPRQWK